MFKTSGGKYIAPQLIENAMKQSRFVEQIMVIGDGEKMPAAFIQPNFHFVKEWASIHHLAIGESNAEISANSKVQERLLQEVNEINKKFGNWEQVKRIELTPDVWSVDGGHLTPTMKLKRKAILEKYKDLYQKIYNQ
jgi:long-chain acyl-CoA synthetase